MLIDCKRRCLQLGSSAIEVPFIDSPQFTVRHKAGKINGNADGLSRTPSIQLAAATSQVESSDNFAKIKEAQAKDAYMVLVYEAVKDGKPPPGLTRQNGKIFIHKGVLCRRFRVRGFRGLHSDADTIRNEIINS